MSSRRTVVLAAALCLAGYVWIYGSGLADPPIRSDGFSYYVYLPSWFLFHDSTLASVARDCCGGEFPEYTAIIRWPGTRRWVNAHPIGVAIMQAPLFPVAHALTKWTNLSPDGFTFYYQHAAGLAGLAFVVAGLAVIRRALLRAFSDNVTAVTLIVLLLGTNLYHYATYDSSYSHPYSFFLVASLLHLTLLWREAPSTRTSVLLGIVTGLIVLVRHTNVLVPMSFGVLWFTRKSDRVKIDGIARIAAVAALVIAPQLFIYYRATGHPVISAYGSLGFNWTSPQIIGVLFGTAKGLFFWSPLLVLAVAGFVPLWKSQKSARILAVPTVVFLALQTYVVASWYDWQFGGSYGHRGFVEALPMFALGLAAFFEWASRTAPRTAVATAVCAALVSLSVFQMLQYWHGILPIAGTTWRLYREVFLQWQ